MEYNFDNFCADCRRAVLDAPGTEGRQKIAEFTRRLLLNKSFVVERFGADAAPGRHHAYHDPESGIFVLLHIHQRIGGGTPHDHGPSWAVYGQAAAYTDMTEYRRLDDGNQEGYADIAVAKEYRMEPGDVRLFDIGAIHSIRFPEGARFVRVTGADLDRIGQRIFDMKKKTVRMGTPVR